MAVDMFMKIDGVTGEAKDSAHADEIDVIAWTWGMQQSGSRHLGGGGGSGKVNVQDLSFTKYVDKSSTDLMLFCCNGKHVKEATLTVRKAGESPVEYIKVKMSDCLISGVSTGGSGGEDRLTENVTLNFSKVEVEYTPQKEDGSGDAPATMGWDVAKNEKV
ncbi:MAG TPA: type VI secretion system tube protein Hcp [Acetobacteraceae bacterium]|jgi:type VI secretion system secreted protein Hcp|nr:type VI secretion system tube protein Hcp [Acetobacteraceae bacterium]